MRCAGGCGPRRCSANTMHGTKRTWWSGHMRRLRNLKRARSQRFIREVRAQTRRALAQWVAIECDRMMFEAMVGLTR